MAGLFSFPKFRASVLTTGAPLAGGKLYVYENGTTTLTNSYTNRGAGTANANPVILDANGEADVWLPLGALYTLKLVNSADVQQWSKDGISSGDISSWILSGLDVYFSAGKVGIGGVAGSEALKVTGSVAITTTLAVTGAVTMATTLAVTGISSLTGGATIAAGTIKHTVEDGSMAIYGGVSSTSSYLKLNGVSNSSANAVEIYQGAVKKFEITSAGAQKFYATSLAIATVGYGINMVSGGSTARFGIATLSGGTILVTNTQIRGVTTDLIYLTRATTAGTAGHLSYTVVNDTSFTINSTSGSDGSTINWFIVREA